MRSRFLALSLLFVMQSAAASEILIDDFDTAEFEVRAGTSVIDSMTGQPILELEVTQQEVPAVLGGARSFGIYDVSSTEFHDSPLVRQFVDVAKGTLQVEANQKPEELGISYGSRHSPLNLDLREQSAIQVNVRDYVELDEFGGGSEFRIAMTSGIGTPDQSQEWARVGVGETFDGSMVFPFEHFGDINTSDVDAISLWYLPSPVSFSYAIDRIYVVPEPSTALLLVLAATLTVPTTRRKRI